MNLLDYIRAVRYRWWILVIALLLGAMAAAIISLRSAPAYETSASVLVTTPSSSLTDLQAGNQFAEGRAGTYAALATTATVLSRAAARIGEGATAEDLATHVTATVQLGTSLIVVTATADDPRLAAVRADAVAGVLNTEVQALDVDVATGSSPVVLQVVQAARDDTLPVGASLTRNIALGAIAGLALGVGFIVLAATLDSRLRTPRDLAALTGRSALAIVPRRRLLAGAGAADGRREVFRTLRTSLGITERSAHSIAIAPVTRAQGASDVVIELGRAMAEGGLRVVLVDGDLRPERPRRTRQSAVADPDRGLAEVLEGRIELESAIQPTTLPNLSSLPAGVPASRHGQTLNRRAMQSVLNQLLEDYDVVIVACPPLLTRSDAAVTASVADTSLTVIEAGRTTRGDLSLGLDLLRGVGIERPALILNNVLRPDMGVASAVVAGAGPSGHF